MDNLDITPAFIDIFQRINKHLDLLPFQKLLNDKNSTLSDEQKIELKAKINESAKKVRQLNLVLDELKDQIVSEIEKVQIDYEEKNRDLDSLEEHLNYVRSNLLTNQQKQMNVLRERTKELNNEMNLNNESFNDENELDQDVIDMPHSRKENNKFNQPKSFKLPSSNLKPKMSNLKPPTSNLKPPTSNLKPPIKSNSSNNILKGSSIKKPSDEFYNQQHNIKFNSNNRNNNDRIYQQHQQHQQQQIKKEKIKNVDYIYLNYPQINYISLSEFNYIPNYMRGRLSFEKCNALVDEFNKTIETKYKFMLIPTSKYTSDELIKYTLYKSQEDDETKGLFFVTPKDLHDYSDLKISLNDTKIFIQCVRHCKRIKEIRGTDRLIRYVVLNC